MNDHKYVSYLMENEWRDPNRTILFLPDYTLIWSQGLANPTQNFWHWSRGKKRGKKREHWVNFISRTINASILHQLSNFNYSTNLPNLWKEKEKNRVNCKREEDQKCRNPSIPDPDFFHFLFWNLKIGFQNHVFWAGFCFSWRPYQGCYHPRRPLCSLQCLRQSLRSLHQIRPSFTARR